MEIMTILLPLAILLALLFIGSFIYATIKGQYDDLETPKYKMLLDDTKIKRREVDEQRESNTNRN
jgi:cbb3-type cytochrome oxidase maturation protein